MNTAILFDVSSIQHYVFGSNKLKDNVGASFIVENLYDNLKYISKEINLGIDIGYIGGGNALVFTDSIENAKKIINVFTTKILLKYPGLSIDVAIKDNFDKNNYQNDVKKLFSKLKSNKGKFLSVNNISSHGITAVCNYSSLPAVKIDSYDKLLSSETITKRLCEEEAKKYEKILLESEGINKGYSFPDDFDKLGQIKGDDSHIAVVHIDGNGFGRIFGELNLKETNELSEKLKTDVKNAFVSIIIEYIKIMDSINAIINKNNISNKIIPLRPLVLGGDDVTFVCHGKLGLWFAKKFMEHFNNNTFTYGNNNIFQYTTCAGIAIVKTKYPFYRAYRMAEDLCKSAKIKHKENGGSWIDFQLAYSGLGNSLEEFRAIHYNNLEGKKLFSRPFRIDVETGIQSFNQLCKKSFMLKQILPNSKIKDFREALTKDNSTEINFVEHLKYRCRQEDLSFEKSFYGKSASECICENPFFDMIELLELYPEALLNK